MATESIISATFGVPGSGKTYSRVRFIIDDFLLNNPSGLFITNIPLCISEISNYAAPILSKKRGEVVTPGEIASRFVIIPDDELVKWEKLNQLENKDLSSFDSSSFFPTLWLQQYDLQNAHIAIDEFHKYFSKKGPKLLRKLWNDWFAEIRKTGCVFEAITQSYGQMSDEFLDKCATRLELVNHSELRDPFFAIRMGDWYELRAGLLNRPVIQRITERETMRGASNSGKVTWKLIRSRSYNLDSFYFRFFNSFRNYSGSSSERQSPSQIYGRKVVFWFLRRNFINLFSRILLVFIVAWFLLGGGMQFFLHSLFRFFGNVGESNSPVAHMLSEGHNSSDTASSVEKKYDVKPLPSSSSLNPNFAGSSNTKSGSADIKSGSVDIKSGSADIKSGSAVDYSSYRPSLFWDDFCVLRNGIQVRIGYKFIGGLLNGREVVRFDRVQRCIVLDDGTALYMHVVGL